MTWLMLTLNTTKIENERLQAMAETTDGFILAERDLQQRGPGDFLGTLQSGFAELHMASLPDLRMIELARFHALNLFNEDPHQNNPEYQLLYTTLKRFWGGRQGDIT